jgi:hypothetical protein
MCDTERRNPPLVIPAQPGWRVAYMISDDNSSTEPVIGWLSRDNGSTWYPIVAGNGGEGALLTDHRMAGYQGVLAPE